MYFFFWVFHWVVLTGVAIPFVWLFFGNWFVSRFRCFFFSLSLSNLEWLIRASIRHPTEWNSLSYVDFKILWGEESEREKAIEIAVHESPVVFCWPRDDRRFLHNKYHDNNNNKIKTTQRNKNLTSFFFHLFVNFFFYSSLCSFKILFIIIIKNPVKHSFGSGVRFDLLKKRNNIQKWFSFSD